MYGAILLKPGRTKDGSVAEFSEDFAVPSFMRSLLSRIGLSKIKSKRLGGVKFQIAESGLESGPLRCSTHDSDVYLYSRHKIPLTYGREFLPIERAPCFNRIFFTHCSPPDLSCIGEVRHRRPI